LSKDGKSASVVEAHTIDPAAGALNAPRRCEGSSCCVVYKVGGGAGGGQATRVRGERALRVQGMRAADGERRSGNRAIGLGFFPNPTRNGFQAGAFASSWRKTLKGAACRNRLFWARVRRWRV
jgi:hypothetical protein